MKENIEKKKESKEDKNEQAEVEISNENKEEEVFIIGGSSIYNQFIQKADKLYLTEILATCKDANVFFPTFDKKSYEQTILGENQDNGITYKHVLYKRRKNER